MRKEDMLVEPPKGRGEEIREAWKRPGDRADSVSQPTYIGGSEGHVSLAEARLRAINELAEAEHDEADKRGRLVAATRAVVSAQTVETKAAQEHTNATDRLRRAQERVRFVMGVGRQQIIKESDLMEPSHG